MSVVYFMAPVVGGLIKIGHTKALVSRLQGMCMWSPVPLEILASAEGVYLDEKRLHYTFREAWSHFEWFRPVLELRALIGDVRESGALPSLADFPAPPIGWRLPHQKARGNRPLAERIAQTANGRAAFVARRQRRLVPPSSSAAVGQTP